MDGVERHARELAATNRAPCPVCEGIGHVCEEHPHKPWGPLFGPGEGCHCGGAGMPCPACCRPQAWGSATAAFEPPRAVQPAVRAEPFKWEMDTDGIDGEGWRVVHVDPDAPCVFVDGSCSCGRLDLG